MILSRCQDRGSHESPESGNLGKKGLSLTDQLSAYAARGLSAMFASCS
jgi:hypothetical protein